MKKFSEYISVTEASTIASLGASKEQVKAIYNLIKEYKSTITVDSNAKFVEKTKKKEVTDLMRSEGINKAIVIGFNDSMMFYCVQTKYKNYDSKVDEYNIYQIDQFGNTISNMTESSAIKAISHFKGVKVYNIAEKGATFARAKDEYGDIGGTNGNDFTYQLSELISKDMEKIFNEVKVKFVTKINRKILTGKLIEAMNMLNRLVTKSSDYGSNYVEKQFSDFLKDGWENNSIFKQIQLELAKTTGTSTTGWGSIPRLNNLSGNSTKEEIRVAGAEVLRHVKEKLNDIIDD